MVTVTGGTVTARLSPARWQDSDSGSPVMLRQLTQLPVEVSNQGGLRISRGFKRGARVILLFPHGKPRETPSRGFPRGPSRGFMIRDDRGQGSEDSRPFVFTTMLLGGV